MNREQLIKELEGRVNAQIQHGRKNDTVLLAISTAILTIEKLKEVERSIFADDYPKGTK